MKFANIPLNFEKTEHPITLSRTVLALKSTTLRFRFFGAGNLKKEEGLDLAIAIHSLRKQRCRVIACQNFVTVLCSKAVVRIRR